MCLGLGEKRGLGRVLNKQSLWSDHWTKVVLLATCTRAGKRFPACLAWIDRIDGPAHISNANLAGRKLKSVSNRRTCGWGKSVG